MEALENRKAKALFDQSYYLAFNLDIKEANLDAWEHYCNFGIKEGRDPHWLFMAGFYIENYLNGNLTINPLDHYVNQREHKLRPHPFFDTEFYASQVSSIPDDQTYLEHFQINFNQRISPSPHFNAEFYLETYKDIHNQDSKINPVEHFIKHGLSEGRVPSENFPLSLLDEKHQGVFLYWVNNVPALQGKTFFLPLLQLPEDKSTIVLVSHEASLTGAPKVILKLAEELHKKYDFSVISLLL